MRASLISARQARLDARGDERLGQQEHVGRAGARQPGDRVEQAFLDADDAADRSEQRLGPRAGRPRPRSVPAAMAAAPAPTSAGVFGMARTTAVPGAELGLERRDRDPRRDRQHPLGPGLGHLAAHGGNVGGLHREHGAKRRHRKVDHRHLGQRRVQCLDAACGSFSTITMSTAGCPLRSSPPDEGLTHLPAPDNLQLGHGRRRYRCGTSGRRGATSLTPSPIGCTRPAPPPAGTVGRDGRKGNGMPQPGKREAKPMRMAGRKNCSTHA